MVDAYNEASDDLKKLMLFYSASVYKEEFEEVHVSAIKDRNELISQELEVISKHLKLHFITPTKYRVSEGKQ